MGKSQSLFRRTSNLSSERSSTFPAWSSYVRALVSICSFLSGGLVLDRPGGAPALLEPWDQSGISGDTIVQNPSEDRTTDISFPVSGAELNAALAKVEELTKEIGAASLASEANLAAVSVVGSGMQNTPGYASRMFRVLADGNVNIDMITTSEIRISCIIKEEQAEEAVRLLHRGFRLDEPE